jgi:hypothetical protein
MARDNNINKTAEQYRWLAAKCRETARTASDGRERAHLLATAQRWDVLVDRVGRILVIAREPKRAPEVIPCLPSGALTISRTQAAVGIVPTHHLSIFRGSRGDRGRPSFAKQLGVSFSK